MKYGHQALGILIAALLGACASHPVKTDAKHPSTPTVKSSPVAKAPADRDLLPANESASAANSSIVGKPLPSGKFAKLKIGMPVTQVEELIGTPDKQWQQATGEATPYYSGPDRWVMQHAYKSEGVLTFNSGQEKLLIRILVNRAE
jgi:hypothetical protein